MRDIIKMTLFDHEGYMITTPDEKSGIFAWKDEGSRPRKRKAGKNDSPIQSWKKVWITSVYHSEKHPGMPWRFNYAGGKYPFCRCHFDPEQFTLLFELLPYVYKEWFGVTAPWSTPVEIKTEFKPKDDDDEVVKLERELAGLR